MGLNVTVTANESFADGATVDRAALRRAAKPTVSITGAVSAAEVGAQSIDNTKLTHMAANTVKVRDANSTGDPSDKAVADTQILIGDGTGFTAAALSGDVTMANTGAVTIAADSVEGTMLNTNAADGSTIELSSDSLSVKADSIGITHLANSTAGTLLSYDATGAAAAVSAGSAGHILTANATGVPTFQANTGAMKLLAYAQSQVIHVSDTSDPSAAISSIVIPANHGFSHVMVEIDVRGACVNAYNHYGLYIGGSQVKTWPMRDTGASALIKEGEVTTLTWINTGNQTADTTVELKRTGAISTSGEYIIHLYGWRIWGLTAP
jgi:hypothetical protein